MTTKVACANCGAGICLENLHEIKMDKKTFYCPNGHPNWFPDGCKHEQTLAEEREVWRQTQGRYMARLRSERDLAHTCPWPTCRSYVYANRNSLFHHMHRAHGMPWLHEVRQEEESA